MSQGELRVQVGVLQRQQRLVVAAMGKEVEQEVVQELEESTPAVKELVAGFRKTGSADKE